MPGQKTLIARTNWQVRKNDLALPIPYRAPGGDPSLWIKIRRGKRQVERGKEEEQYVWSQAKEGQVGEVCASYGILAVLILLLNVHYF